MIIYHGSNLVVESPKLIAQNRYLDFGYGFYTTRVRGKNDTLIYLNTEKTSFMIYFVSY